MAGGPNAGAGGGYYLYYSKFVRSRVILPSKSFRESVRLILPREL